MEIKLCMMNMKNKKVSHLMEVGTKVDNHTKRNLSKDPKSLISVNKNHKMELIFK